MSRELKIALPLLVLVASLAAAYALITTGPQAERRPPPPVIPLIEVETVQPTSYRVEVESRGTVSPRTQSTLVPEVAGLIIDVAPSFRNGGFFERGEPLVFIDARDYENTVTVARAELAQARLRLVEEEAQADQALRDWAKLNDTGEAPPALVARKPQLASARASVAAAEARLRQAEIDLQRTRIRAPYAGRLLEKSADVGQYVTPGNVLATIYAVDYVEIRLPLTDEQQAFLRLPEDYRDDEDDAEGGLAVTLFASLGRATHEWPGRIVRTEGAIDTRSRQLFVVAQVDDPYARRDGRPPLKVGQFVRARIPGRRLDGVFVLPRGASTGDDEVFVVTPERRLERRAVEVIWRDGEHIVVAGGLEAGERISLTPLPFAADGVQVRIQGEDPPERAAETPRPREG
ncbi:MAG: efflux RND transporter periplasmic adaptor subunit [Chromatiales bacterium]|jgi:RND family efflux transporter MFP subunit